jgi:hypothetical protein
MIKLMTRSASTPYNFQSHLLENYPKYKIYAPTIKVKLGIEGIFFFFNILNFFLFIFKMTEREEKISRKLALEQTVVDGRQMCLI